MRESKIERAVCDIAKQKGWQNFKLSGPNDRGKPDRLFFSHGGRVKFVEFKSTGQKPTALQLLQLQRLTELGFDCHVIDSIEDGRALFD